jgi:hypothetical protein
VLKLFCKTQIINVAKRFYDFLTVGEALDVWWGRKKVVLLQFLFGRVMPVKRVENK